MGTALTAASAAGVAGVWQGAAPAAADFFQDTALLAGAAAMPEGTLGALRRQLTPSPSSAVTAEISPGITFTDPEPEVTDQKPVSVQPPEISPEYRGVLISETMAGSPSAVCWQIGAGWLRNYTEIPRAQIDAELSEPLELAPKADGRVEVLIMHTHATESYQTWPDPVFDSGYTARSKSTALNMCAVGEKMAQVLNAAGIRTLHDETLYDAPGYTDSYKRSRAGVQAYLERYPSIKVVLDVHRDAIEDSDGTRVKPVCEIDGESTAQVMVIAGCGNGSSIALPNWRLNLRFAAEWEAAMESAYPGLTRPVLCGYRFYNQDLTTGSLLIEIGGHANTLDEALRAGEYAAKALAGVLGG